MSRSRFLSQDEVTTQTDQELAKNYRELQKLRTQVRIAECGRVIPSATSGDLLAQAQRAIAILE
jgi:hypothetical protein